MKRVALLLSFFIISCLTLKASQDSLQQYVAKFKFPEGSYITEASIVLENGTLTILSDKGNATIQKTSDDQFAIPTYNGTALFIRNASKKVTGIKIEAMGLVLEGTREEDNAAGEASKKIIIPIRLPMPILVDPIE